MHDMHAVLYQIKKESGKRSSPLYEPDPERDDLRKELSLLRTKLRNKDTEMLRMQTQIDQLRKKIVLFQTNSRISSMSEQENQEKQMQAFSQIPMIFENKELKENNQLLHKENLDLNGKNHELEAQLRQQKSDNKRLQSKLKQLSILQKMREERFKDELQKLTPIIVEENRDFTYIRQGVMKVASFMRQCAFTVAFEMFMKCAKDCEKQKKVSSFSIFKNYWNEIKQSKSLGFLSIIKAYQSIKKLAKTLNQDYLTLQQQATRDTMNEWVLNTIIQIRHSNFPKQKEQKLFRFLSLYYRSKYPIKSQKYQLDNDAKEYFQDLICQQLLQQLI